MNEIILRFVPILVSWMTATIVMKNLKNTFIDLSKKKHPFQNKRNISDSNIIPFVGRKKNIDNCYYLFDYKNIG